jgi:beta-galactosidase
VPPWLARQYPEIAGERGTEQRIPWGARQEMDFTHPAFRFHAERVTRKVIGRYADHPAVIGYQVDNEPGNELLHNRGVFQRFVDHLRRTYGEVTTLNREWGLVYWSHQLSTWEDLWLPDGNAQPQYEQAWRRFQADQVTEFITWQAEIAREYARPGQFVTTCLSYDRPGVDDEGLTASLDVTAGNSYHVMQDGLALPAADSAGQSWATVGTWAMYLSADRMYASRQEPFLVTETNAQSIGPAWTTRPGYDGQLRQVAWALVSRGARMIEYWQWRSLHFGTETYWGGVLPHNGRPGRIYRELARIGAELAEAGDLVDGLTPDIDVAMLFSVPSKWAIEAQPPLALPDGGPDRSSYRGIFDPFYRGAFDAGLQMRLLHAGHAAAHDPAIFAARHPVLVAAALYVADDATLDWLAAYAHAGGHLVLGPRSGYADPEARARPEIQPARLATAAGVRYDEYSNLATGVPVRAPAGSTLHLPDQAAAGPTVCSRRAPRCSPSTCTPTSHSGRRSPPASMAPAGSPTSAPSRRLASPRPCSAGWSPRVAGGRSRPLSRRRARPHATAVGCASCTTGRGHRPRWSRRNRYVTCWPAPTTVPARSCRLDRGTYASLPWNRRTSPRPGNREMDESQ